jgi:serine/threonine protein kinase
VVSLSPLGSVHQTVPAFLTRAASEEFASTPPSYPPSSTSSSSTFTSPLCSPVSPVSPGWPLTPPPGARPNMGRRQSHDLFECIEEYQRLSESQARYIFAQVVDIIDYLDGIGVTHRDIKDENVLIDRAFRVKLIDFGAASCVDPRAPRPWYRHFRGTVAYAPAEIIKGAEWHQAEPADIWALGILLAYLITGKSAFPTAADAAHGRISLDNCSVRAEGERPVPLRQESSISIECWDLLTRCLDPDPRTRVTIAEVRVHPWLEHALDAV